MRLVAKAKFAMPFAVNQLGSVVYVYVLGRVPAQLCSVLTNSLTSLITLVTEGVMNKERMTGRKLIGMGMIMAGIPLVLM